MWLKQKVRNKNMGKRLSVITTRTGDSGMTGLGDGSRISKDSVRIHALGDIDELNSHIGMLMCAHLSADIQSMLYAIQHDLFDLGGELCIPNSVLLKEERITELEKWIESYNSVLPRLEEFILPGGSVISAQAHICRTICRRAERTIVALAKTEIIRNIPQIYLNRLSDLLFILARFFNQQEGDVLWNRQR